MSTNQTNPSSTGNQDDATRIQNTKGAATGSIHQNSSDATRIESNTPPPSQHAGANTQQQTAKTGNNEPSSTEPKPSGQQDTKNRGFSNGAFAAGIAGAAIAGTAGGAIFSEEITDAANQVAETVEGVFHGAEESAMVGANPDALFEMSGADQEGNTYSVSFIDANHDGTIDSYSGNIDTVSGENIAYAGQGNPFEMFNTPEMAEFDDFMNSPPDSAFVVNDFDVPNNEVYHIQAGDTLSEIAMENGTSVEEIMELNPDIQNPDLIYADNDLNLPEGSEISGFTESNEMQGSLSFADEVSVPDGSMDQIDWNDFENPDYASNLNNSNFDDFSMPDSYEDNGYTEFDNDSTSSDFL